jgi:sterol desaturase/sphingolipid hydroxylase (fatty acid hydroxylase superfamily)
MSEVEKIYTWGFDSAAYFIRYFLFAGIGYFVFYVWKHKKFTSLKIQKQIPAKRNIQQEIVYSILTLLIYCSASWLVFYWQKHGATKIYLDIHQYGYAYFIGSIIVMVLIHDAYFYWTHRMMHLPKIFQWFHKTHHHSHNPTPWSAFSFHPLEALISIGIIPIIIFAFPSHPFALFLFISYMTLINVMGHLGYETFPEKFRKNKMGKWHNTSTNHNAHHQQATCNFGLYFTFWDRLMKTYSGESNYRN